MSTKPFEIACGNITSLSFKPDGTYIVTGDRSGTLRAWSITDNLQISLWTIDTRSPINTVVVSTDGRWIVSGGTGGKVTVWSTVTRKSAIEVTEHTADIRALDISNDSKRFASGSADNTVRIFDIISGTVTKLISLQPWGSVTGVKFSPDSIRIAISVPSHVRVYDTSSGNYLFDVQINTGIGWRPITSFAWPSDGQQLFVAFPGKITCFDISTRSSSEWRIHGDSNSQQLFAVTNSKFIACSSGSSVSFWDYTSREQIGQVINHATVINRIAISHDGRRLACGHDEGITVHNLEGVIPEEYLPGILSLPLMRVSAVALEAWVQGDPTETEAILSDEIAKHPNPTHDALAVCALVQTQLGKCRIALETAKKSLQIKPSPIGQIAKSIALAGTGDREVSSDEFDFMFCDYDPSDNKLFLVIKSILLFVCNQRQQAISRIRRLVDSYDDGMKDMYLQVLGMMYLKQGDYGNAAEALGIVKNPFTVEDRGPLMTIFIIFNWNFENLKFIAWQRACERMYVSGSVKEVGDTLLKMVNPLPEDEKERAHGQILQEIITRSGQMTLLGWTGKSSTYNSCLPSSPATYTQTSTVLPSLLRDEAALRKRTSELRTIFPLMDALGTYILVTHSQPVRFTCFHLHLPCIVFRVKALRREQENVYRAETAGLGNVEFTTADSLPLKQARKLVFVNPWIDHLRESPSIGDEDDGQESDGGLDTHVETSADADRGVELVHEPMIEEVSAPPSCTSDGDIHTRALELIARLGQPFSALLLLKQPDGAYKRVAADHEIIVRGIEDDTLRDLRVEVLEVV